MFSFPGFNSASVGTTALQQQVSEPIDVELGQAGQEDKVVSDKPKILMIPRGSKTPPPAPRQGSCEGVRGEDMVNDCGKCWAKGGAVLGTMGATSALLIVGILNIIKGPSTRTEGVIETVLGVVVAPIVGCIIGGCLFGSLGAACGLALPNTVV